MVFATFIIAILCGMGLGSGGLFIVYLTMFLEHEQLSAQGLNLYFFIFSTAAAMLVHLRGKELPIKRMIYLCGFGICGCVFGAALAQRLDSELLRNVFAILLIVSGTLSLFSGEKIKKTLYK